MLSGEGNAEERWKTTIGLSSKKSNFTRAALFVCTFLCRCFARLQLETSRNFLVASFFGSIFFTAAHFHLALVAACISHFFTAVTKFSCCSSNKKMSFFFFSRSKSLSPFFSLSFAGLPPTFSFSLCFSCSIFQIFGRDNKSKLNTLENTDTETISAFHFPLHWLFSCFCFTRRGWLCDFPSK